MGDYPQVQKSATTLPVVQVSDLFYCTHLVRLDQDLDSGVRTAIQLPS